MQNVFKDKEHTLVTERDSAVQEVHKQYEIEMNKIKLYKREKEVMVAQFRQVEIKCKNFRDLYEARDSELRIVMQELDKQKKSSHDRVLRLRNALID